MWTLSILSLRPSFPTGLSPLQSRLHSDIMLLSNLLGCSKALMILPILQNKEYSVSVIQALPVLTPAIAPPRTPCSSHMEMTTLRSLTIRCTYKLSNCFPCSMRPFSPLKSYLYFKDELNYLLPVKSSCTEVITPFAGLLQCFINQYIYYNAHRTANYWNACLLY